MGTRGGVVCLGLAVLDVVQRVEAPLSWGRKHVSVAAEVCAGGPATNAAVCAARLLGEATLITGLGGTAAAAAVRAELETYAVRVIDLAPPEWVLPVAACVLDPAGERTVISPGALATTWELTGEARAALQGAAVVLLDGHHPSAADAALAAVSAGRGPHRPAEPTPSTPAEPTQAAPSARRSDRPLVVLDAGSAKAHAEAWLPRLDVVAGSADYAAGLGLDLAGAVAHVLAAGAGAAVMTDGAAEVLWAGGDGIVRRARPPRTTAVDTLGAGDAFHGALAALLAVGRSLDDAVPAAAAVAATRVANSGARGWLADLAPLREGAPLREDHPR